MAALGRKRSRAARLLFLLLVLVSIGCNGILGAELGVSQEDDGLDPATGEIDAAAGGQIDPAAGGQVVPAAGGQIDAAAGGQIDAAAGGLDSGGAVTPDSSTDGSVAPSSAKDITRLTILGVNAAIVGTSIALTLPFGANLKSLTPTITITGASVSPASGVAKDFTSPVTYTVTAADSTTKAYAVKVTVAPSSAKDITRFTILGVDAAIVGTSISLTLPFGTNIKSLTPTITITGASVSPASGVAKNFTKSVTYTVTAADTTMKVYTVTVKDSQR